MRLTFGERVAKARAAADMTVRQLAEAAGVSRSTVHKIERGAVTPTLYVIVCLANALDADPADFVSGLTLDED